MGVTSSTIRRALGVVAAAALFTGCTLLTLFDLPPSADFTVSPASGYAISQTITLDATNSNDPQGYALSYFWTLTTPQGSAASLNSNSSVRVSFVPDIQGNYTIGLSVTAKNKTGSTSKVIPVAATVAGSGSGGSNFLAATSYSYAAAPDSLVRINRSTGAVTALGSPNGPYFTALCYNPATGQLYGVGTGLYQISTSTFATTQIGSNFVDPLNGGALLMTSMAFSSNGTLYVLENAASNPRLFSVNLSTGALTTLGTWNTPYTYLRAIAINPLDATMYGGDFTLYKVNASNAGLLSTVGGFGGTAMGSLTFSSVGTLFGMDSSSSHIYSIDMTTGAATSILALPAGLGALVLDQTGGTATN
jgi:hypothetical protein